MDDQYREIYEDLYESPRRGTGWAFEDYGYIPEPSALRVFIDDADDRLHETYGKRLRSDAKYILMINFSAMVVSPILIHGGDGQYLWRGLRKDIELLTDEAAKGSEDNEISAHTMVSTLSAFWEKLNLAETRLWGASPRPEI